MTCAGTRPEHMEASLGAGTKHLRGNRNVFCQRERTHNSRPWSITPTSTESQVR